MSKLAFTNQESSINKGGVSVGTGMKSAIIKLGVDCGNGFTKTNGKRFASAVVKGKLGSVGGRAEGHHQIVIDGKPWIVGRGEKFICEDRYTDPRYKICLLTAIAMEAKSRGIAASELIVDLCVGVPQNLHKNDELVADLRNTILGWEKTNIQVDNNIEGGINANYNIKIRKVIVFVEGALCLLSNDMSKTLTIDLGEGTYNACLWENGAIIADDTDQYGAQYIFQTVKEDIEWSTGKVVKASEVEECIMKNIYALPIGENGELVNLEAEFCESINTAVRNIYTNISKTGKFNFNTIEKIQLLGGTSSFTYEYIEKIPAFKGKTFLVENAQFINSEIYEAVINHA